MTSKDSFGSRYTLNVDGNYYEIFSLPAFAKKAKVDLPRLPYSLKVMLENLLRNEDGRFVKEADITALATRARDKEIAFTPARVLMQDFTGVPAIVDLAAMRDAMKKLGGDPEKINPLVPVDLVIDHSVQVDQFGTGTPFAFKPHIEYQ